MLLTIEKIINNAYGLSHMEDGKVIMVPYSAEGDVIEVSVTEEKKGLAFGKIQKIITPSPYRVEPLCKYYTVCGGCNMLHLSEKCEIDTKKEWLKNDFKRDVDIVCGDFTHYRSRVRFSYVNGKKGFKKRLSNEVVEIDNCPLLASELNQSIITFGNKTFYINDSVFFQANHEIALSIANYIKNSIKGDSIYDFYGGVGFFSSFLEDKYNNITCIEENKNALTFARKNLKKTRFINKSTEKVAAVLKNKASTSIVDPPRVGMTKKAIETVSALTTNRIIYVSCDYKTQIRDLKEFEKFGFILTSVLAFNMFPRTSHLEVVCILDYNSKHDKRKL